MVVLNLYPMGINIMTKNITISPELCKPREEVVGTSLGMPSGIVMTWMALLADEQDGREIRRGLHNPARGSARRPRGGTGHVQ